MQFFGSSGSKIEIRPMFYILLCDIHHIKNVLTTYHLPKYNYFTRFGKQNKNFMINFGCISLNDQTCNSNHFIIVKILAWL